MNCMVCELYLNKAAIKKDGRDIIILTLTGKIIM